MSTTNYITIFIVVIFLYFSVNYQDETNSSNSSRLSSTINILLNIKTFLSLSFHHHDTYHKTS